VPGALSLAFRYWPETPMGRRLLLGVPKSEEVLPDSPQRQRLRQLVGHIGVARTMMMPSGAIEIDGHTVDALSEGIPIEPGQTIEVIEVRGTRVVVRPTSEKPAPRVLANDLLSQPLESLGIEGFDEPLS
jgi:membrane-bound serine protease (ClpP class)